MYLALVCCLLCFCFCFFVLFFYYLYFAFSHLSASQSVGVLAKMGMGNDFCHFTEAAVAARPTLYLLFSCLGTFLFFLFHSLLSSPSFTLTLLLWIFSHAIFNQPDESWDSVVKFLCHGHHPGKKKKRKNNSLFHCSFWLETWVLLPWNHVHIVVLEKGRKTCLNSRVSSCPAYYAVNAEENFFPACRLTEAGKTSSTCIGNI